MNTIIQQFNDMLDKGTIPVMEFELPNNDYLVVDIMITDRLNKEKQGVLFSLSHDDIETFFSGDVEEYQNNYCIPYDECFDNLDYYLEQIHTEVMEGLLIPNNLLVD